MVDPPRRPPTRPPSPPAALKAQRKALERLRVEVNGVRGGAARERVLRLPLGRVDEPPAASPGGESAASGGAVGGGRPAGVGAPSPSPDDAAAGTVTFGYGELLGRLRECVSEAAEARLVDYETEVSRAAAARGLSGWSYTAFFATVEALAFVYGQQARPDLALRR